MDAYYPDLIGVPNGSYIDLLFNYIDQTNIVVHKDTMKLEIPIKNSIYKFTMSTKE